MNSFKIFYWIKCVSYVGNIETPLFTLYCVEIWTQSAL